MGQLYEPATRNAFEQQNGVTYCRRCGYLVVSDRYPDKIPKPCKVVKVGLR